MIDTCAASVRLDVNVSSQQGLDVTALYISHGQMAHRVAYRVVRDRELAADVVQEAFISIWRARDSYTADRGPVGPWLCTLVRRRAVDAVRRHARDREVPLLDTDHPDALSLADSAPSPERHAHGRETWALVMQAVATLALPKRQVVVLALYGYSQTEIAATLELPLGTVKTRMLYAKRQLRQHLSCSLVDIEDA